MYLVKIKINQSIQVFMIQSTKKKREEIYTAKITEF